jgi:hypothetical protein
MSYEKPVGGAQNLRFTAARAGVAVSVRQPALRIPFGPRCEVQGALERDLLAGIKRIQPRHMPVSRLCLVQIRRRFLSPAVLANRERQKTCPCRGRVLARSTALA